MKYRCKPYSRFVMVLGVVVFWAPSRVPLAAALSDTEIKIRLMADALRARDGGDYNTAKRNLEELAALAPADQSVQRLLTDVGRKIVNPPPVVAATNERGRQVIDVEAEAIALAESERLHGLMKTATEQMRRAREKTQAGNHEAALLELDHAAAALPVNPLTEKLLTDLQRDKTAVLIALTRSFLREGNVTGARLTYEQLKPFAPGDAHTEALARQITETEARQSAGTVPSASPAETLLPEWSPDEIPRLVARGRSQYLAGESKAAEETFHALDARLPGHPEAARFLARINTERNESMNRQRTLTRGELLQEVDRSWQRPGVVQERVNEPDKSTETAPLTGKLDAIVLPNVSFNQVEIGRVITALSAASEEFDETGDAPRGVNMVLLDPSDKNPTLSITLRNTSLKRVLDFVTQAVGYQYEIQTDAVVVRPGGEATTLATDFFPVTRATVLRMTGLGGGPATGGIGRGGDPYSSAGAANDAFTGGEAQAMQAFLQQAGVNFEAVTGSSLAYDGSAIIVTQTARNLERIRNILNRYNDIRQVEIEAKFMEVQEGALEELGVNWNVTTKATQRNASAQAQYLTGNRSLAAAFSSTNANQQGSIVRPVSQTAGSDGSVAITPELNLPIINNAPQIPGSAYLGAGVNALANITGVVGEFDINAIVRALVQKQGTDLLSAPKITVLSGNPATITVAQELRYPQRFGQTQSQVGTGNASGGGSAGVAITAGTPEEFATRNVGVELKVTPTVEEDDYSISLDLNPKVTEFDGFVEYGGPSVAISGSTTVTVPSGFYQPIFSVRDISTKVTIWDGATLIMGGLTREEVKKVNDKVPLLGDIPLLGRMFRSKGESAQKRNLLIFVTANLVSPGGSPKKQALENVVPRSLFQNATVITPSGAVPRSR